MNARTLGNDGLLLGLTLAYRRRVRPRRRQAEQRGSWALSVLQDVLTTLVAEILARATALPVTLADRRS
jgi:hypothetical protein